MLFSCYLNIPVFLSAHARLFSHSNPVGVCVRVRARARAPGNSCRVTTLLSEHSVWFHLPASTGLHSCRNQWKFEAETGTEDVWRAGWLTASVTVWRRLGHRQAASLWHLKWSVDIKVDERCRHKLDKVTFRLIIPGVLQTCVFSPTFCCQNLCRLRRTPGNKAQHQGGSPPDIICWQDWRRCNSGCCSSGFLFSFWWL